MRNGSCKSLKCKKGGIFGLDFGKQSSENISNKKYMLNSIQFHPLDSIKENLQTPYSIDNWNKFTEALNEFTSILGRLKETSYTSFGITIPNSTKSLPLDEINKQLQIFLNKKFTQPVIQSLIPNFNSYSFKQIKDTSTTTSTTPIFVYGRDDNTTDKTKDVAYIATVTLTEDKDDNAAEFIIPQVSQSATKGGGKSKPCPYTKTSKKVVATVNGVKRARCVWSKDGKEYVRYKVDNKYKYKKV